MAFRVGGELEPESSPKLCISPPHIGLGGKGRGEESTREGKGGALLDLVTHGAQSPYLELVVGETLLQLRLCLCL